MFDFFLLLKQANGVIFSTTKANQLPSSEVKKDSQLETLILLSK